MSKIKTKMVVDYSLNMITMDVVTDEETKDVINTIWYILEVNDMTEEYLPELHRLKAQLFTDLKPATALFFAYNYHIITYKQYITK